MVRGTTPTHIFKIPFSTGILQKVKISYRQDDKILVERDIEDCTFEENKISVTLTQEETLLFSHRKPVELQLKVQTIDSKVMATPVMRRSIDEILSEDVF